MKKKISAHLPNNLCGKWEVARITFWEKVNLLPP